MSNFTPGPWKYEFRGRITDGSGRTIEASGLSLVAGYRDDSDPCWDNARLIAAAPDLLEALQESLHWICEPERSKAFAAIAKATKE